MPINLKTILNAIIVKKRIATLLVFLLSLLYFILNNGYYNQADVLIKTRGAEGTRASFYWDTGMGFNERECINFKPYRELQFADVNHKVEITRLADFNRLSSGSEVWIDNIYMDNDEKRTFDINKTIIPGKTFVNENKKVQFKDIGTSITFEAKFKTLNIVFYVHRWAGKAKIVIDGKEQVLDLYSEGTKAQEFTFNSGASPEIVENKFALPQLDIKAMKFEFSAPVEIFNSVRVKSIKGLVELKPEKSNSLTYIFKRFDIKTASFNWLLFIVQLLLSFVIAWIFSEIWTYVQRLKQPSLRSLLKYIFLQNGHYTFWLMFVVSFSGFLLWLLGQWPGVMTVDSYHYTWREIKSLNLTNVTPWIYNIYILALTQIYDSPAIVALFQILVTASLGSYIFYYSLKNGARRWIVFLCFVLFVLSIPVGIFNITLWKDIPFNAVMLFWGFIIFHLYYQKKYKGVTYSLNTFKIAFLSFTFILLLTLRFNGIIFVVFIPVVLIVLKLLVRKNLYQFIALSVVIYSITIFVSPVLVKVDSKGMSNYFSAMYKVEPMAGIYSSKIFYSPSPELDKLYISKWQSEKELKENYIPDGQAYPIGNMVSKWVSLTPQEQSYLNTLYYKRSIQNLHLFMADRTTMFLGAMGFSSNIFITTNELYNSYDKSFWRPIESYKLTIDPKLKILNKVQNFILNRAKAFIGEIPPSMVVFNTFPFMIIFFVVLFLNRWFPASALYSSVFIYNLPFLFLVMATCEWRYLYFLLLSAYFIFPLMSIEYSATRNKGGNS